MEPEDTVVEKEPLIVVIREESTILKFTRLKSLGGYSTDEKFISYLINMEESRRVTSTHQVPVEYDYEDKDALNLTKEKGGDESYEYGFTPIVEIKLEVVEEDEKVKKRREAKEAIKRKQKLKRYAEKKARPQKDIHSCTKCPLTFRSVKGLNAHQRHHNASNGVPRPAALGAFSCEVCGKSVSTNRNLLKHMLTHSKEKAYKCDMCGKCFRLMASLDAHLKLHMGDVHVCPTCGKAFATMIRLKLHQKNHVPDSSSNVCTICGRAFLHNLNLKNHMRIHTGDTFVCDICGKSCLTKSTYEDHKRRHDGIRPYPCVECDKTFVTRADVANHRRSVHTAWLAEKTFACEVCGRCFPKNSLLEYHQNTHLDYRPFKCDTCNRTFRTKTVLDRHQVIHTGEKNHKCEQCDSSFAMASTLYNHVRIVHLNIRRDRRKKSDGLCRKKFTAKELRKMKKPQNLSMKVKSEELVSMPLIPNVDTVSEESGLLNLVCYDHNMIKEDSLDLTMYGSNPSPTQTQSLLQMALQEHVTNL